MVEKTISDHRMLEQGDTVLVGVSGGPDSVALLHILMQLAQKLDFTIGVAHLNHCLRGQDSDRDAHFVASLAESMKVPCYCEDFDVKNYQKSMRLSLEEAARKARYAFLERISCNKGYTKIALGHQKNDNAELILMFLFRGSGPLGLSGIPPTRKNVFIRPLINISKNELVAFLNENGLSYQDDKSNLDLDFLRNRIRHETIPYIKKRFNPGIVENLNRLSEIVRSEDNWINTNIKSIYKKVIVIASRHKVVMSIPALMVYPEAVQRRIMRTAIENVKGNLLKISFSHIEAAIELITTPKYSGRLMLPEGIRIQRDQNLLSFFQVDRLHWNSRNEPCPESKPFFYRIERPQEKTDVTIAETGMILEFCELSFDPKAHYNSFSKLVAFLDMDLLCFPLVLRSILPGDRFTPSGMTGVQKVKKYFIDHKIDRAYRQKSPVLLNQDKIVWLVGHRISEIAKTSPATRRVLKIEIIRSKRPDGLITKPASLNNTER